MVTSSEPETDGRIQRSERSREAIVRGMLELIGAGNLSPTAQQIASHANVGVRTVFRHFSDMNTLFATMHERLEDEIGDLFVHREQAGDLDTRVGQLVERRITLFERIAPYERSSALHRPGSGFLQRLHERSVRSLRRDLQFWLPELGGTSSPTAQAIEMILSFEAYERLRIDQNLSIPRTQAALHQSAHALTKNLATAN